MQILNKDELHLYGFYFEPSLLPFHFYVSYLNFFVIKPLESASALLQGGAKFLKRNVTMASYS